ncbi:3024_t:CDS:2, partial [Acaulospora colombiana]
IERLWATLNHLSSSTSKMTPGFRHDTLNLHLTDWNARKTKNMVPGRADILDTLLAPRHPSGGDPDPGEHGDPAEVAWVNEGLEIEDMQLQVKAKSLTVDSGVMDIEHDRLAADRNVLIERIAKWRSQRPATGETDPLEVSNCESDLDDPSTLPEHEPLSLPSNLPPDERLNKCSEVELSLREGQANDALAGLRLRLSQQVALY